MLEALGVNTSKTFALFETGEELERGDEPSPTRSAVLTRLSHGHIRIGTFQRLAFFGEADNIAKLVRYCLEHLYGEQPADDDRRMRCGCSTSSAGATATPRRVLSRRRLRPRRAQQRQHQRHRRELRLRPVALHARLGPGLHRRLFRPLRALRLRPPARGDPLGPGAARRLPGAGRRSAAAVRAARRLGRPVRGGAGRRDAAAARRRAAASRRPRARRGADHGACRRARRRSTASSSTGAAAAIPARERYPSEPFRALAPSARRPRARASRIHIGPTPRPARCISTRSRRSGRRSPSATTGSRSRTRLQPSAGWARR